MPTNTKSSPVKVKPSMVSDEEIKNNLNQYNQKEKLLRQHFKYLKHNVFNYHIAGNIKLIQKDLERPYKDMQVFFNQVDPTKGPQNKVQQTHWDNINEDNLQPSTLPPSTIKQEKLDSLHKTKPAEYMELMEKQFVGILKKLISSFDNTIGHRGTVDIVDTGKFEYLTMLHIALKGIEQFKEGKVYESGVSWNKISNLSANSSYAHFQPSEKLLDIVKRGKKHENIEDLIFQEEPKTKSSKKMKM